MADSGISIDTMTAGLPSATFHLPAPALRPFITSYHVVRSPGPLVDTLHPEWGNIRVPLRGWWQSQSFAGLPETPTGAVLYGSTDRARWFRTGGGAVLGIGLTPIGWVRLIGRDASALANQFVPLGDTLGVPGERLVEDLRACPDEAAIVALLDRVFEQHAARAGPEDALAVRAHHYLVCGEIGDVADFGRQMGLNDRTLSRLCLRVFGFAPKRLLRRQRFLRTLAAVRDRLDQPLGSLIDPDYYDQAHFIREFRAFMGTTPRAYFHSPREAMRRIADERMRVIGAPVQGLHPPAA